VPGFGFGFGDDVPPPYPPPQYSYYQQQQFPPAGPPPGGGPGQPGRGSGGGGRALAAIIGAAVVVMALIATVVFLATDDHPAKANASDTSSATASTGGPTASSTPSGSAGPTDTSDDTDSQAAFDPSLMDDASTDPAPFTTDALMPQTFTDSKGVEYELDAGGVESCVQNTMSDNVQSTLRNYNCSQVLTGSYTVDSDTVDSNDDILVSVQIFAFDDATDAAAVYAAFPSDASWDFGIWCPQSGDGANPCSTGADYQDAYKSEWLAQDHRYVIEATALYTDLAQDGSVEQWTSAAAKSAVDSVGPAYYISNQD
jgi:hypothetical protein